jgi:hypothetical protein
MKFNYMSETLLIVLIVVLDFIAVTITLFISYKAANHEIPTFVKGGIGAICGIAVEIGRIFAARAIVGETFTATGTILPWMVVFRIVGIPILVGLGFMAGSTAGEGTTAVCPACQKLISLNITLMKQSASSAKEYNEPCPFCQTILTYETETFKIISHKPKTEDEEIIANEKDREKSIEKCNNL